MGIYDRDHRQNDPWKRNSANNHFNDSNNEIKVDQTKKSQKLTDEEIKTYYENVTNIRNKSNTNHLNEDISRFNQAADARRKLREFKQTWNLEKPKGKSFISFLPWIAGLFIILAVTKEFHKHNMTEPITPVSAQNVEQPIFKPTKALVLPSTSILSTSYDQASATCPFTLIADNKNYYVKLCDMLRGGKTVAKFFVRAGEELKTTVPAGNYKIKFGSGDEWYGEKELFGQFSQYGESESLNFDYDGYTSQGHTISFYQQVDGNFHTNDIDRDAVLQN